MTESIEIFCAYAPEDELLRENLEKHLSVLKHQGWVTIWYDRKVGAGKEWVKEIDEHLNSAHIILLLISTDFLASDHCYGILKRAMERYEKDDALVIPLIMRPVADWEKEPIGQLSSLPFDRQPVMSWPNPEKAYLEIAKGLRQVVEAIRAQARGAGSTNLLEKDEPPITIDARSSQQKTKYNFGFTRTRAQILTPSLILLLGTTPTVTGQELMYHMLSLGPGDRQHVALVYIDTDEPSAELTQFRQEHQNAFQEFPLRLEIQTDIHEEERTGAGWKETQHVFIEKRVPQRLSRGTHGIRNDGHIAACLHYDLIYGTLERALYTILHPQTDEDVTPSRRDTEVQVNIVAFLGGGTGSGILSDMAVLVRDLLVHFQVKQRLNLFGILPEPIPGASLIDLNWRKSNATACLLEMIAYSTAAVSMPSSSGYHKYMGINYQRLTPDPIATEIYLIGSASLTDVTYSARLVGFDLFQRITDASGSGFLENSKWVDRRTLGATDDRGLPTMFGTTCPLEVSFPAEEVAKAFAQMSASHLLLEFEHYHPPSLKATILEENIWLTKWNDMLSFQIARSKPISITLPVFRREEFLHIRQPQLDDQWYKLETFERDIERQIKAALVPKYQEEEQRVPNAPHVDADNIKHLRFVYQQIQSLQKLLKEYTFILEIIEKIPVKQVPSRPVELEKNFLHFSFKKFFRDYPALLCSAYNERIRCQAEVTYYRILKDWLHDLNSRVKQALSGVWFSGADIRTYAEKLRWTSLTSPSWRGHFERPHPHQRHLFASRQFHSSNDRNIAMERLYRWTTGGEQWAKGGEKTNLSNGEPFRLKAPSSPVSSSNGALIAQMPKGVALQGEQDEGESIWESLFDYRIYTEGFTEYLRAFVVDEPTYENISHEEQNTHALEFIAEQAINYFQKMYNHTFRDMNLFELLEKAISPSLSQQEQAKQVSDSLYQHLQHMRGLMSNATAFEANLFWPQAQTTLETSMYLGIRWNSSAQKEILERALENLGPLTRHGYLPLVQEAFDPHRLQFSYGQHAISLSEVRDFYLERNSAMEAYLLYQQQWKMTNGIGSQPVHSSGEAQRLVEDKDALGYGVPLAQQVIRRPQ